MGNINIDYTLDILNMESSLNASKPESNMHLQITNLEDACLEFTQMSNVKTRNAMDTLDMGTSSDSSKLEKTWEICLVFI